MIKDNLLRIEKRIISACSNIDKDAKQIDIVAVSKGRAQEEIKEAISAGVTDIGENRVQEALNKYNQLFGYRFSVIGFRQIANTENRKPVKWHMVGHLQVNKVKDAVRIFDLIQSVDSFRLAAEIDKQAAKINKIQDILIEVNVSGEQSKFGFRPDETVKIIKEIALLKNINIEGLMAIVPIVDNPEKARPFFRKLKELLDKANELRAAGSELRILSMGMTDDFEVAIEEGSNMIRLGRAIFEGKN